jgi:hypothetical protein
MLIDWDALVLQGYFSRVTFCRSALILQALSQNLRDRVIGRPFIRNPLSRYVRQLLHRRLPRASFLDTSDAVHGPVVFFFPERIRRARRRLNDQSAALTLLGGIISASGADVERTRISSPKGWLTGLERIGIHSDGVKVVGSRRRVRIILGSMISSDHSRFHSPN